MYTEEEDSLSSPGVFARRRSPVFPHENCEAFTVPVWGGLLFVCQKKNEYFHITPFLARLRCNIMNLNPTTHGTENDTQSVYHPVVDLRIRRLCLTRLEVVSKIVDLKNITRTLPKRPNQIRYWHPKLRAKPDLPKYKRESIVIGTTLDVPEEPQRLPRQGVRSGCLLRHEAKANKAA